MKFESNSQLETYTKEPVGLIILGVISLILGLRGIKKNLGLLHSSGNFKVFLFLFSITPSLSLVLFGLLLLMLAFGG